MPTRPISRAHLALLATLAANASLSFASTPATAETRYETTAPVIAFGDVHGAYDELVALLQRVGAIDGEGRWSAGDTHLVSLGDLLDRGAGSRQVLELLMRLQDEASAAGGRVHVIVGNHETMNLTGDLRYVSRAEYEAFRDDETAEERAVAFAKFSADAAPAVPDPEAFDRHYPPGFFAHRRAFRAEGRFGSWLLAQPLMRVINDTLYVHGGLAPWVAESSPEVLNARLATETRALLELGDRLIAEGTLPPWQDLLAAEPAADVPLPEALVLLRESPLFGDASPNWYRGTAACHPLLEQPALETVLGRLGVDRVVVGHTVTADHRVQTRFGGRAILADTGMLTDYYHGRASALVFGGGTRTLPRIQYLDEPGPTDVLSAPPVDLRTRPEPELQAALGTLPIEGWTPGTSERVEIGGVAYTAVFDPGDRRQIRNRLAALALDKLLGLGMVPPTAERKLGAKSGTLSLLPAGALNELERQSGGARRPNWCATGNDYQLMYAFDALIGKSLRNAEQIVYDPETWLVYLTGHDDAFVSSLAEPLYLGQTPRVLPEGLARRLRELDEADYAEVLGDLLNKRLVRAVVTRAAQLLDSWTSGT